MALLVRDYIINPFVTAIRTLSIIPVPGRDTEEFSRALVWFPVVGGLLSLVLYGLYYVGNFIFPEQEYFTALFMFGGISFATGGLHLDGLADTADGFGGGHTREGVLEIMKDPRQGTFGVLALIIDSLLKIALYYFLISVGAILIIILSLIVSRTMQAMVLVFLPYARKEGGTANAFCNRGLRVPVFIAFIAVSAVILFALPVLFAGVLFLSAVCATGIFAWYCLYKIDGITGDCIGAVNELSEAAFLISAVVMINHGARI